MQSSPNVEAATFHLLNRCKSNYMTAVLSQQILQDRTLPTALRTITYVWIPARDTAIKARLKHFYRPIALLSFVVISPMVNEQHFHDK